MHSSNSGLKAIVSAVRSLQLGNPREREPRLRLQIHPPSSSMKTTSSSHALVEVRAEGGERDVDQQRCYVEARGLCRYPPPIRCNCDCERERDVLAFRLHGERRAGKGSTVDAVGRRTLVLVLGGVEVL